MKKIVYLFYILSLGFFVSFPIERLDLSRDWKDGLTISITILILALYMSRKKKKERIKNGL
jgi:hypothetical protein